MSDGAHIAAALEHAGECQPREACGVIADGAYVRLRNEETRFDSFAIDMREFHAVASSARIEAVVHSHVRHGAMASDADRAACDRIGLPFLIVSWPSGRSSRIEPRGKQAPLVGRQWQWLVHDCFTLVRDGLAAYAGIRLADYPRSWEFWERHEDLILRQVDGSGFVRMPAGTAPQHLDLMVMAIGSSTPNHLGLFLAPDRLLHQLLGRLSVRELYSGPLQRMTVAHLRHERFLP